MKAPTVKLQLRPWWEFIHSIPAHWRTHRDLARSYNCKEANRIATKLTFAMLMAWVKIRFNIP